MTTPEMLETFVKPRDKDFKQKLYKTRPERQAIRLRGKEAMRQKWSKKKDFCPIRLRLADKLW